MCAQRNAITNHDTNKEKKTRKRKHNEGVIRDEGNDIERAKASAKRGFTYSKKTQISNKQ